MIYIIIVYILLIILLISHFKIGNTKEPLQSKNNYTNLNNYFDRKYLDDFKNYEKVLLVIQSGEITIKDVILLNKYISIYSNKLIGWSFIDSNLNI
jgi:membrane protein insertase Oxa1/YidC/SpoIIIJ